jgi:2'-5' RNA ligase
MRLFVAIDIDDDMRVEIGKVQQKLMKRVSTDGSAIKWVDPELMHLTLKFAGDVDSFSFDIKGLGYFGSPARVGWIGIEGPAELSLMQKEIAEMLSIQGLAVEDNKGFHGHLTLCRVKNFKAGRELERVIDDYGKCEIGTQSVDAVYVYSSELTKKGPEYAIVSSSKLKR